MMAADQQKSARPSPAPAPVAPPAGAAGAATERLEPAFVVRVVWLDSYMAAPLPGHDACWSELQRRRPDKVPVVRIFGSTPAGQRACLHLHGLLPYFYVPFPPGVDPGDEQGSQGLQFARRVGLALDAALAMSDAYHRRQQQEEQQGEGPPPGAGPEPPRCSYVYGAELVKGTSFYGFHEKESLWIKLLLYRPQDVNRAANLMLSGAVLGRPWQPHESHLPYLLKVKVDLNLYGMGWLRLADVKFRRESEQRQLQALQALQEPPALQVAASQCAYGLRLPHRALCGTCELELDARSEDVLNQLELVRLALADAGPEVRMVESLAPMWADEAQRCGSSGIPTRPASPPRAPKPLSAALGALRRQYEAVVAHQRMQGVAFPDSQDQRRAPTPQERAASRLLAVTQPANWATITSPRQGIASAGASMGMGAASGSSAGGLQQGAVDGGVAPEQAPRKKQVAPVEPDARDLVDEALLASQLAAHHRRQRQEQRLAARLQSQAMPGAATQAAQQRTASTQAGMASGEEGVEEEGLEEQQHAVAWLQRRQAAAEHGFASSDEEGEEGQALLLAMYARAMGLAQARPPAAGAVRVGGGGASEGNQPMSQLGQDEEVAQLGMRQFVTSSQQECEAIMAAAAEAREAEQMLAAGEEWEQHEEEQQEQQEMGDKRRAGSSSNGYDGDEEEDSIAMELGVGDPPRSTAEAAPSVPEAPAPAPGQVPVLLPAPAAVDAAEQHAPAGNAQEGSAEKGADAAGTRSPGQEQQGNRQQDQQRRQENRQQELILQVDGSADSPTHGTTGRVPHEPPLPAQQQLKQGQQQARASQRAGRGRMLSREEVRAGSQLLSAVRDALACASSSTASSGGHSSEREQPGTGGAAAPAAAEAELAGSMWERGLLPVVATQPHYGQLEGAREEVTMIAGMTFRNPTNAADELPPFISVVAAELAEAAEAAAAAAEAAAGAEAEERDEESGEESERESEGGEDAEDVEESEADRQEEAEEDEDDDFPSAFDRFEHAEIMRAGGIFEWGKAEVREKQSRRQQRRPHVWSCAKPPPARAATDAWLAARQRRRLRRQPQPATAGAGGPAFAMDPNTGKLLPATAVAASGKNAAEAALAAPAALVDQEDESSSGTSSESGSAPGPGSATGGPATSHKQRQKQFVSMVSPPSSGRGGKATPFSQGVFKHCIQGKGQQLTLLCLEMHADSRGALLPDPRHDAVRAVALALVDDDEEVPDHAFTARLLVFDDSPAAAAAAAAVGAAGLADDVAPGGERGPQGQPSAAEAAVADRAPSPRAASASGQAGDVDGSAGRQAWSALLPLASTAPSVPSLLATAAGAARVPPLLRNPAAMDALAGVQVDLYSSEEALLAAVVDAVLTSDPDIVIGFEVQQASLGYLADRASELGLPPFLPRLSRLVQHPLRQGQREGEGAGGPDDGEGEPWGGERGPGTNPAQAYGWNTGAGLAVKGRVVLNVWRLMRGEVKLPIYTLQSCAAAVLALRTPHFPQHQMADWFHGGPTGGRWRCLAHLVKQARLPLALLDRLDLVGRTGELARTFGIDFESVLTRGSQYRVESMMARLAHTQNYLLLSASREQVARQPAMECIPLVMEPESRLYTDPVVVLDFQSLYPSMIIAYNLCFSTCLGKPVHAREGAQLGASELELPAGTLGGPLAPERLLLAPNGVAFAPPAARLGVLPRLLREILDTRVMVKAAMKRLPPSARMLLRCLNARQFGLKLIANLGRETLEAAIRQVEDDPRWRARVVYGDTDSLFVLLPGRTRAEAHVVGAEMAAAVTAANPSPVTLKMEKVYHPCVLQSKKRYVGFAFESPQQAKPAFDAKGIETVRRDTCPAVSKMLERTLRILFATKDLTQARRADLPVACKPPCARSRVREYLETQWTKILGGRVSVADFVFAKEVRLGTYSPNASVLPPAALVATRAAEADPRHQSVHACRAVPRYGERVRYVVVHGQPEARLADMVMAPSALVEAGGRLSLHAYYYITRQIIPGTRGMVGRFCWVAIERVLSLVGADARAWFARMPRPNRALPQKRPVEAAPAPTEGGAQEASGQPQIGVSQVPAATHVVGSCTTNASHGPVAAAAAGSPSMRATAVAAPLSPMARAKVAAAAAAEAEVDATVDLFYLSHFCPVCEAPLEPMQLTCNACRAEPQLAVAVLAARWSGQEARYCQLAHVCRQCGGGGRVHFAGDGGIACDSLDCGVYFERRKAWHELRAAARLGETALEALDGRHHGPG
eukprot:scaffold20.g7603.t1